MKDIELPRKVIVGDGALEKVKDIAKGLSLSGKAMVLADKNTAEIAGNRVCSGLGAELRILEAGMEEEIENTSAHIKKNRIKYVAGVGGGTVIDITKVCAYNTNIPFLSIPTAASHDGITSPQASIKGKNPFSKKVHSALGIIADTEVIRKAPAKLTAAGCADAISNYSAVLDWKLAHEEKEEYYGDYAASLSMLCAQIVMYNAEKIEGDVAILVEALISSGVAMGIAGSSRPCSGSEHQFSHVLDAICPKPALHGEQCGVGTIMMTCLHGKDWEHIRDALRAVKAPVDAKGLGIEKEYIIKALTQAHTIRDRYTILRGGLSEEKAIEVAEKTGVI
jgi:glycerol-1-phosphate dehydrogenase [NAD(P)+]